MKLLLDTHAFLWFILGDAKLSTVARTAIEDPANESHLSVASIWEMAIKASRGRLTLHQPFETLIRQQVHLNGIVVNSVSMDHALFTAQLPAHHADPFDRLLIAHSLVEQIPVVNRDQVFDQYGVQRIW